MPAHSAPPTHARQDHQHEYERARAAAGRATSATPAARDRTDDDLALAADVDQAGPGRYATASAASSDHGAALTRISLDEAPGERASTHMSA